MKQNNVVQEKSYKFALKLISFLKTLSHDSIASRLSDQVLRSGTSIGANVEEALGGFSKDDFTFKMNTALKEARETHYWLRIMRDMSFGAKDALDQLVLDAEELRMILTSVVKSSKHAKHNS